MVTVDQIGNNNLASFHNISKLNILNSKDIELQLMPLVSQSDSSLTLNFSGIRFIDSSGFETLLSLYKVAKINNSNLNLINLSDELLELVNLVKLDTVFQLN
ncbi:MAG: STAS domain-containing protein [Bacteroidales bacterium]|jgi:anti-anti-sigma factor|nr:STAS domain-containing protein [Bacteroidales bacterium]